MKGLFFQKWTDLGSKYGLSTRNIWSVRSMNDLLRGKLTNDSQIRNFVKKSKIKNVQIPTSRFFFFDKIPNLDIFGQFSSQKVICGPYGPYSLSKSSHRDCTDHIFLVESPYMDLTDQIFLVESPNMDPKSVHFWKSPHIETARIIYSS